MIDAILRPLVDHPKRHWIVITLTFLLAVVFAWPAVDVYFAAAENRNRMEGELREGEEIAGKLELYQQRLQQRTELLLPLEARVLSSEEIERFREQLVEWVKASGCKLRRVKLADPQFRPWYEDDHPLDQRARSEKDKKSPFKLRQQQLSLLVSGSLENLIPFLSKLGEQERLTHTGNFQLRKSLEDPNVVEMDLDLILFSLVEGDSPR